MSKATLNLTKEHQQTDKPRFVILSGYVWDELKMPARGEYYKKKDGYFYKIVEVRKIRHNSKKGKGILNLGETLQEMSTEDKFSEELIPESSGEVFRSKLRRAKPEDSEADTLVEGQLNLLIKEWISHFIVEEDYEFLGMLNLEKANQRSSPATIHYNTTD